MCCVEKPRHHIHTKSGFYAINRNLWPAILLMVEVWIFIDHCRGASANTPVSPAHARQILGSRGCYQGICALLLYLCVDAAYQQTACHKQRKTPRRKVKHSAIRCCFGVFTIYNNTSTYIQPAFVQRCTRCYTHTLQRVRSQLASVNSRDMPDRQCLVGWYQL